MYEKLSAFGEATPENELLSVPSQLPTLLSQLFRRLPRVPIIQLTHAAALRWLEAHAQVGLYFFPVYG